MRDAIYITVICCLITFIVANHIGRPAKMLSTPTTYSTTQIDNLIQVDALLASKIKQQMDYEQSFSQKQ